VLARPLSHPRNQMRLLGLVLGASLVLGLLPTRSTSWAGWFADLARNVVAPISHPVAWFSAWVSPGDPLAGEPELVRRLTRERERFQTLYLRELHENRSLRDRIEALQAGRAINPDLAYDIVTAPVIARGGDASGGGGGILTVRLGRADGVEPSAVATIGGYQLVGRVVEVGSRTCLVRPITDRDAGALLGRVLVGEDGRGPVCRLSPSGDGLLRGPVEGSASGGGPIGFGLVERGAEVRLADPGWADHAQMLLIGRVARVLEDPDRPLRVIVEVEPSAQLGRVGQVEVRLSARGGGGR